MQFDQGQGLIELLRQPAPHWAGRRSCAATDHEFLDVLVTPFDLSGTVPPREEAPTKSALAAQIARFLSINLHKGPTLKTLAEWLGYSEKYCSELFRSVMGEPFSHDLAHRRIEVATLLLRTTDKSIAEISSVLGFSDQFAFSHFFKRLTGRSPRDVRAESVSSHLEATR